MEKSTHNLVLINFLCPDFQGGEKPREGPLEIEIFLLRGLTKGVGGGSGAFLHLYNQQKNKISKSGQR